MVDPELEEFFCPQIQGKCKGKECIAMQRKRHHWTNEGCMGEVTHHIKVYYQCKHYNEVEIWTNETF